MLQREDTLYGGHIILEGRLRLLDDADVEAVFGKHVVDALPAGTICPGSVHEDDIFYRGTRCLGDGVLILQERRDI
jgi:hypothetical protein